MNTETTVVETFESEEENDEPTEEQVNEAAANLANEANVAAPTPTEAPAEEKIPRYVAVQVNPDQFKAIKAFANGKALSGVCLQILADVIPGLVVDTTPKAARTKYASEAEKKAAQKAARQDRNALIKQLLEAHAKAQAEAAKAAAPAA